jgi:hypothetical protein
MTRQSSYQLVQTQVAFHEGQSHSAQPGDLQPVLPVPVRPHRSATRFRASTSAVALLSVVQRDPFQAPSSMPLTELVFFPEWSPSCRPQALSPTAVIAPNLLALGVLSVLWDRDGPARSRASTTRVDTLVPEADCPSYSCDLRSSLAVRRVLTTQNATASPQSAFPAPHLQLGGLLVAAFGSSEPGSEGSPSHFILTNCSDSHEYGK